MKRGAVSWVGLRESLRRRREGEGRRQQREQVEEREGREGDERRGGGGGEETVQGGGKAVGRLSGRGSVVGRQRGTGGRSVGRGSSKQAGRRRGREEEERRVPKATVRRLTPLLRRAEEPARLQGGRVQGWWRRRGAHGWVRSWTRSVRANPVWPVATEGSGRGVGGEEEEGGGEEGRRETGAGGMWLEVDDASSPPPPSAPFRELDRPLRKRPSAEIPRSICQVCPWGRKKR